MYTPATGVTLSQARPPLDVVPSSPPASSPWPLTGSVVSVVCCPVCQPHLQVCAVSPQCLLESKLHHAPHSTHMQNVCLEMPSPSPTPTSLSTSLALHPSF